MSKTKILVVDDELIIRKMLQKVLSEENYDVEAVEDGCKALDKIENNFYNLVITDLKMPGINGLDLLKHVKKNYSETGVIIITGFPTTEVAVEAMKNGAYDFICKPFDLDVLIATIKEYCCEKQNDYNL